MTSYSTPIARQAKQAKQIILSVPVQAALFLGLTSLTVWTLYFSPYPPTHDSMHQARHQTMGVACH